MATITKTIGATGRDYATVAAWAADLDNAAIYAAGDVASGVMYNDAPFTTGATISGGATIGLSAIRLGAAVGHRHGGVIGAGVRVLRTASGNTFTLSSTVPITLSDIEINYGGFGHASADNAAIHLTAGAHRVERCIIHNWASTASASTSRIMINVAASAVGAIVQNNLIFNVTSTQTGSGGLEGISESVASGGSVQIYNNTIHGLTRNTGSGICRGINTSGTNHHVRNNVATDVGGTTSGAKTCIVATSGTTSNNCTSDASADDVGGTGHIINAVAADLFENPAGGDFKPKAGSALINAGAALGSGVAVDITGRDREAAADVWDIGAFELVVTSVPMVPRVAVLAM